MLLGAVVNGPNDAGLFADGLDDFSQCPPPRRTRRPPGTVVLSGDRRRPPPVRGDALPAFTGHGSRFVDDVSAWQTVEPATDFDAAAALAFALLASP